MQAIVRRASASDAAALAALRLRWLAESGGDSGLDSGPDSRAFVDAFSSWVTEHLTTHLSFLAEVDDDVVGMAWLMVAQRVPSPDRQHRRFGDVQSVYVVPELRNAGIGAALMRAVLAEARRLELEHVTVHSSGRGLPLYQRAGFRHDRHWLRWAPG